MDYETFKKELAEELREFYGQDAKVDICAVRKNNGKQYDGVQIILKDGKNTGAVSVTPVISLEGLYELYGGGDMTLEECAKAVCREREKYEAEPDIRCFAENLSDWEAVKEYLYPVLIFTGRNREILEELVSVPMLDLSVVYTVRMKFQGGWNGCVKVSRKMLEDYGIDAGQLHEQAMRNLKKDGYRFQDIETVARRIMGIKDSGEETVGVPGKGTAQGNMYVLTNASKAYGAAGILYQELLREFAGKQDFFILPSSVHETIFVPVRHPGDKKLFDSMVAEVNEAQVDMEERLSDHCYYYDGQKGEIRMCA